MNGLLLLTALRVGGAATVEGTVVQAEDGAALGGVAVQAYDEQLRGVEATADANGRFILEGLEPGRWRVRAVPGYRVNRVTRWAPDAADFCDADVVEVPSEDAALAGVEVRLEAGARLSGRILDSDGAGVGNAVVWAGGGDDATRNLVARPTLTATDGSFEVTGLDTPADADDGDWVLWVDEDSFPDQYIGPAYEIEGASLFTVPRQGATDAGSHGLLDGILVEGTVLGPTGPLPGAEVAVYAGSQVVNVVTDDAGRYVAIGLPPGDVLPWVNSDGVALTYWPDADRPDTFLSAPDEGAVVSDADLFPPAEAVLSFRFLDPTTGDAVPGMQGLLYNDTRTVGRGDAADDGGVLRIDSLHGGAYSLYAYGARFSSTNDWVRGEDGEPRVFTLADGARPDPIDLPLPPALSLSGTIRGEDGLPIYNATVVARQVVAEGAEGAAAAALTERDGTYTIVGLPPGDYAVEAGGTPLCPNEPGLVTTFWPGVVNPDWASPLPAPDPRNIDSVDLVLARDADQDGMADAWEVEWGLEPWRNDALEDPDLDGYDNYTEFLLDTDPLAGPEPRCGCGGPASGVWLLPLVGLAGWRRRRHG